MELVHTDGICVVILVHVQYEVKCPLDSTKWIIQESPPQFENQPQLEIQPMAQVNVRSITRSTMYEKATFC